MKYIMALVMCLVVVSVSAQELPFDLKIGMSRYDAEMKITLLVGQPAKMGTNKTVWSVVPRNSSIEYMEQKLIILESKDNSVVAYSERFIILQTNDKNKCKRAWDAIFKELEAKLQSVSSSKYWKIEKMADDKSHAVAYHINNKKLKRIVEFSGESSTDKKTVSVAIDDSYFVYNK